VNNLYWNVVLKLSDAVRYLYWQTWKIFHINLYKNPKKIVPVGIYCYETISGRNKNGHRKVKYCLFHKYLWEDLCMFDGGDCIYDSCKTCNINYDDRLE